MKYRAKAVVFDFDGVILDSVPAKSSAFRQWVTGVSEVHADEFIAYSMGAYGTGRNDQIKHFFDSILNRSISEKELNAEVAEFARLNRKLIFNSPLIEESVAFLKSNFDLGIPQYVLSGTPDEELAEIVSHHKLSDYFVETYGAPTKKMEGLITIAEKCGCPTKDLLFIGDATADANAARAAGSQFIHIPSQAIFAPEFECDKVSNLLEFSIDLAETVRSASYKQ